jgi:DNA-binding transcriptional MocR family regulator
VPTQLSRRVQRVKPSPTLAVTARAAKLKAEGKDIIGLGAGEPDFDTPAHIADAGVEAIRKGFTRYTNVDGIVELKDAIIAKFKRDNGINYERNQILVSSGAKQTIYNLCMAVLDTGDEAIIPAPYWVSYPDMVLLADGLPVTPNCPASQGYKMTPRQLEAAITPKTKLLLINSPCNPTGAAYTRAEWRALADVLLKHPRVIVGTDDMYEKIWWGQEAFSSLLTVRARTLRPRRHHQRRVEVIRHDRLAPGLLWGPEGNRERHVHAPGPEHEQRLQHHAEGGARRAQRRPEAGRGHEHRVQEASTTGSSARSTACPASSRYPAPAPSTPGPIAAPP